MDWRECIQGRIVKNVKKDKNLIKSTREIAEIKIQSASYKPNVKFNIDSIRKKDIISLLSIIL